MVPIWPLSLDYLRTSVPIGRLLRFGSVSRGGGSRFEMNGSLVGFLCRLDRVVFVGVPILTTRFFVRSRDIVGSLSLSSEVIVLVVVGCPPVGCLGRVG